MTLFVVYPHPRLANSQVTGGGQFSVSLPIPKTKLFGGRILQVIPCTCSLYAFMYIKVGLPVPAELVLTYASLQYLWYSYKLGSWALGDAVPVKVGCYQYVGVSCVQTQQGFAIWHIGTSPGLK